MGIDGYLIQFVGAVLAGELGVLVLWSIQLNDNRGATF